MSSSKGLKRDFVGMKQRRLEAGRLFAKGRSPGLVARELTVSRQSACRWFAIWQEGGMKQLRGAGRAGRKGYLTEAQLQAFEQSLKKGPQELGYETPLWTAPRIADLIERQTGVRYHTDHIYRLLQKMGWSCQRPVGRALERNEAVIRHWKRHRLPAIKKKPLWKAV